MGLDYKTILVANDGPVRTITLNRPQRRNAMTPEMQTELLSAFEETAQSRCRVLVIAGAGEAFCAGLDLSALEATTDTATVDHRAEAERIARLFLALRELPMPTIAAVHGAAIAGGSGLALICDFTIATPNAKFGFTEVRIGFIPALVSAFLALQLGDKQSRDVLLTGRIFNAEEALRLGLVNEVVSQGELAPRVRSLAESLLANSPQSLAATKQLMADQHRAWLDSAIVNAIEANAQARETADFHEGVTAFLEKRKPMWNR
ncbi:MAG TPA: enoyl-CoA hydratase-related protein [Terracidiphilus sp.]|nr:enoyl-CoA hydratase-related protein [Terracidiphilus sp.]